MQQMPTSIKRRAAPVARRTFARACIVHQGLLEAFRYSHPSSLSSGRPRSRRPVGSAAEPANRPVQRSTPERSRRRRARPKLRPLHFFSSLRLVVPQPSSPLTPKIRGRADFTLNACRSHCPRACPVIKSRRVAARRRRSVLQQDCCVVRPRAARVRTKQGDAIPKHPLPKIHFDVACAATPANRRPLG